MRRRSARPAWALPGGCGTSAKKCAARMRRSTAPTGPVFKEKVGGVYNTLILKEKVGGVWNTITADEVG